MVQERGIEVVAITKEGTPLCDHVDYLCTMDTSGVENTYLSFYYIVLKLLNLRGEFDDYNEFVKDMEHVHESLIKVKENLILLLKKLPRRHTKNLIRSGLDQELYGEMYTCLQCVF